jgi:5S rRNA maturation endonuclease (ribonuclease M5)
MAQPQMSMALHQLSAANVNSQAAQAASAKDTKSASVNNVHQNAIQQAVQVAQAQQAILQA